MIDIRFPFTLTIAVAFTCNSARPTGTGGSAIQVEWAMAQAADRDRSSRDTAGAWHLRYVADPA